MRVKLLYEEHIFKISPELGKELLDKELGKELGNKASVKDILYENKNALVNDTKRRAAKKLDQIPERKIMTP